MIGSSLTANSALWLASLVAAAAFMPAAASAVEPAETKPPAGVSVGAPEATPQVGVVPANPRKIAHRGCYYPFPTPANDADEPIARQFQPTRGAEYLDGLTRQWTKEAGCVTCHTTLSYSL